MLENIALVIGTAVLSSTLTLIMAYVLYKMKLKAKLMAELDELADVMKVKLRDGVEEAGLELLPRFRSEVREGFKEAINSTVKGELLEENVKSAVKTGSNIMETGLNILMGKPSRKTEGSGPK